jgi:hypothetical protein
MSTAFPSSLLTKITDSRLILNEQKASTESLFTRYRQVTSLSGGTADRWEGLIQTASLKGTDLRTMWAFLVAVGEFGEITVGEPDYTGPTSGQTTALVQGGSQTGTSLIVDGVTPSVSFLLAGEYFQVGTEFKVVTADCTASGGGVVTINFKPTLRASPADNAALTLTSPQLLARLTMKPERYTNNEKRQVFALPFEESL